MSSRSIFIRSKNTRKGQSITFRRREHNSLFNTNRCSYIPNMVALKPFLAVHIRLKQLLTRLVALHPLRRPSGGWKKSARNIHPCIGFVWNASHIILLLLHLGKVSRLFCHMKNYILYKIRSILPRRNARLPMYVCMCRTFSEMCPILK